MTAYSVRVLRWRVRGGGTYLDGVLCPRAVVEGERRSDLP